MVAAVIKIESIDTKEQTADIFTKPLAAEPFNLNIYDKNYVVGSFSSLNYEEVS